MVRLAVLNYALTFSCLVGLGLSLYAYFVELAHEQNENFVASCDFSEHVSCSKAFDSRYGRGFGVVGPLLGADSKFNVPNSLLGIVFYSLVATLAQTNSKFLTKGVYVAVILSNLSSVYFATILYFVLYTLCVICVGTYLVNFVNLILVYHKLKVIEKEKII